MKNGKNPAVFLDRDGTINIDKGYLYRKEDVEYLDGAVEALRCLCNKGFLLVIITNQSGIARGYYTEQDFQQLAHWMWKDLKRHGVIISKTYYCPHCPKGIIKDYIKDCECRKPKTELFWRAQGELDIDMDRSFAIGDRMRDLMICRESEVKGILLSENYILEKKMSLSGKDILEKKIQVCNSWNEILQVIISQS